MTVSAGVRWSRKSRTSSSAETMRLAYSGPMASTRKFLRPTVSPSASGSVCEVLTPIVCGSRSSIAFWRCGVSPSRL